MGATSEIGAATRTATKLPRWVVPTFLTFTVALVPWTVWLVLSLPRLHTTRHYNLTWIGFDIGLIAGLGTLAWLAWSRSTFVEVAAGVSATLLTIDAWFDVTGSDPGRYLLEAVASAVFVELPIAGLCLWLAIHAEDVRRRDGR